VVRIDYHSACGECIGIQCDAVVVDRAYTVEGRAGRKKCMARSLQALAQCGKPPYVVHRLGETSVRGSERADTV
jgi:hypothetical protein